MVETLSRLTKCSEKGSCSNDLSPFNRAHCTTNKALMQLARPSIAAVLSLLRVSCFWAAVQTNVVIFCLTDDGTAMSRTRLRCFRRRYPQKGPQN